MTSPDAGSEPNPIDPIAAAARAELGDLFEIELLHRRGPASIVYLARDRECNGRLVALKVMLRAPAAGAAAQEEFHRAAAAAAVLDDPYVALMYSSGTTERCFWYTSTYVDGPSLDEVLRNGPMELSACLRVVRQVARALECAHQHGVVHADLKPTNVVFDGTGAARVTDFWVPRVLEQLGALGEGRSTRRPEYVAPEERSGEPPGPAADQYALGLLLCECLLGRLPDPEMGVGDRVPGSAAFLLPAGVPRRVVLAAARALSPAPAERFAALPELIAALHAPAPARAAAPAAAAVPAPPASPASPAPPLPVPGPGRVSPAAASVPLLVLDPADFDDPEAAPWRRRSRVGAVVLAVSVAAGGLWLAGSAWMSRPNVAWSSAPIAQPNRDSLVALSPPLNERRDTLPAASPPPPDPSPPLPPRARTPARRAPEQRPAAPAPGRLFVNASPWGQVYLDGVLLGNTPKAGIAVAAGTHRLRVTREGFQPFERVITVASGRELRVTDIVLRELRP